MLLKLSLPKGKIIWALAHPFSREYIHRMEGIGYQECRLIVTETHQPVEVKLYELPKWAQTMVITSIKRGELINTGDNPFSIEKKETLITLDPEPVKEQKSQTRKRPRVNRDG